MRIGAGSKKGDRMLKKWTANRAMRKCIVFAFVFAMTGVLMGSVLVGITDSEESHIGVMTFFSSDNPRTRGSYSDFVLMVREANGGGIESLTSALLLQPDENSGKAGFVYLEDIPMSRELQEYTYGRCEELGLEYELVLAIMWRESRFQTDAVGYNSNGTKDNGIMQINDVNREYLEKTYGITNLMDPYQNIQAGTAMLAEYMKQYGDEKAVLMAYHLGEAGMQRKMAEGVTTNSSVITALSMRDSYKQMIQSVSTSS